MGLSAEAAIIARNAGTPGDPNKVVRMVGGETFASVTRFPECRLANEACIDGQPTIIVISRLGGIPQSDGEEEQEKPLTCSEKASLF